MRYRTKRVAFDVVSVFGCLQASGLPVPVIVSMLREHGYSSASVRNQLVRMVQRGIISSERIGRVSIYRLSDHILSDFGDIAGDHVFPEYQGRFHTIVYSLPEVERGLRDQLQYIARSLGYRQLRPGLLIGCADPSRLLLARLPHVPVPAWSEAGVLTPDSLAAARRMTNRAFELDAALAQLPPLEERMNALSSVGSAPGTGCAGLSLGSFFDLYYDVARAVPCADAAAQSRILSALRSADPRVRGSKLILRTHRIAARILISVGGGGHRTCRSEGPGRGGQRIRAILLTASVSRGRGSAKLKRICPAPTSPQSRPSVTATSARDRM